MRYWDRYGVARRLRQFSVEDHVDQISQLRTGCRAAESDRSVPWRPARPAPFGPRLPALNGASNASRATSPRLPQIDPLGVDAGHPPVAAGEAQQLAGIELHGVGMVLVHVADDALLALGQAGSGGTASSSAASSHRILPKPRHQMGALDGDPIEVEILEAGIHPGVRMARQETPRQARRRRSARRGRPASPAGPVRGWSRPAGAVEQQRYPRRRRRWPWYVRQGRSAAGSATGHGRPPPAPARHRARSPPSTGRAVARAARSQAAHQVADARGTCRRIA